MSFISWFLFVIFGGIGLFALPLDYIYAFCNRPKKISQTELTAKKKNALEEALRIREIAREAKNLEEANALKSSIFSSKRREYNNTMRKLRAAVKVLDDV